MAFGATSITSIEETRGNRMFRRCHGDVAASALGFQLGGMPCGKQVERGMPLPACRGKPPFSNRVGIVFYGLGNRVRHAHGIWHLFVLGGTTSHYVTVLGFVS
jgi:hypothetical protein